MKRYILMCSCLFIASSIGAAHAYDCKKVYMSCSGYGHTSCPSNYIACPFNTGLKKCDEEADTDDFKFSLPNSAGGWNSASSWKGNYIFGYNPSSGGVARCFGYLGSSVSHSVQSHTHAFNEGIDRGQLTAETIDLGNCDCTATSWGGTTSNSLSVTSKAAGGSYVVPITREAYGYLYAGSKTAASSTTASIPSTGPTCSGLGYKHKIAQCPGTYVVCPMDIDKADGSKAVLCDLQAQAGEIKYSLRDTDHDGWLRVNDSSTNYGGRKLKDITSVRGGSYANSELATIIKNHLVYEKTNVTFFGTTSEPKLPEYSGIFLRIADGSTAKNLTQLYMDDVGPHTHTITYGNTGKNGASFCGGKRQSKDAAYNRSTDTSTTLYTTDYSGGNETRPANIAANIFIYSGLLQ